MPANTNDLRAFFRTLTGEYAKPLHPEHRFYVPRFDADPAKDPILALETRIDFSESESVNLLTGYRGNGKSTELNRLRALLERRGCVVYLVNMLDFLITSKPLELSDFLLSLMAALSGVVQEDARLKAVREGYWERFVNVMKTRVEFGELGLEMDGGLVSASIGAQLQRDPTFKERIQQHLRGHLSQMVRDAQDFVAALVAEIRKITGDPDKKVVLLVDSLEQLRGYGEDASKVQSSVVELFTGQAANLRFPTLHVVYTVPPFLSTLAPGFVGPASGNPLTCWPNVHVRTREGVDDPSGLALMVSMIETRFPKWNEVFARGQVERLARFSGGDVRDFFRLVRECTVSLANAGMAQVDEPLLARVEGQLRSELTPIAAEDARWLARVRARKDTALEKTSDTARLARFLDTNLIMNYLNGEPWFDVHPALDEEIRKVQAIEEPKT